MRRSRLSVAVVALVAASAVGLLATPPAYAASQSLFGTTVDLIALPSGDGLLGGTAHVPIGGGSFLATLASPLGSDVEVTLLDGATSVDSCTIVAGDTLCGLSAGTSFPAGPTGVTVRFTMGTTTVDYTGTVFAVTGTQPSVDIEWQDASGAWVNGSAAGLPFFGDIALRCVVTNNSNAPITFSTFTASVTIATVVTSVPITGTLAPGETGRYAVWNGPASDAPSGSCSGSVMLRDGTGSGNGTGGGVIPISGTITVDRTPAAGVSVTITGDRVFPPIVTEYAILLDGLPVPGSPVTAPSPDFDFSIPVAIPASIAPGDHVITVVASYSGRTIVYAAFPFSVQGPQLAVTGSPLDGAALAIPGVLGLLGVTIGALAVRRSSRPRRT